ncbi:MAG: glucose 1-dehydrogenase [Chloroflexi bacterium]|nr:glucose 1-dehydrogenase [Chloroflexota bacterium]MDA1227156.1 glucose 1-dehydrogenase [Chloroflexota bacterium]
MRLQGKVALISGGARGLGAEEAGLFAQEDASVVIGDILVEEGKRVAAQITKAGGNAKFVRLDATSEDDWISAVKATNSEFGRLDILINNAGIFQRATVAETTSEGWDRVMDINAKGVFLGTKAAIPAMRASGGGSIVNISSVAGIIGSRMATAYNASKGAVRLLTKTTAIQYAKEGIRCNSVHPGLTETDMAHEVYPEQGEYETSRDRPPLGRLGRPIDVAYGVLFLASDESSYMTGSELIIDGGITAQ